MNKRQMIYLSWIILVAIGSIWIYGIEFVPWGLLLTFVFITIDIVAYESIGSSISTLGD